VFLRELVSFAIGIATRIGGTANTDSMFLALRGARLHRPLFSPRSKHRRFDIRFLPRWDGEARNVPKLRRPIRGRQLLRQTGHIVARQWVRLPARLTRPQTNGVRRLNTVVHEVRFVSSRDDSIRADPRDLTLTRHRNWNPIGVFKQRY